MASRFRQIGPILVGLVVVGALAAAGLFHTTIRVRGLRLGYALSAVTNRHAELLRQSERLRLEVATLKAPARIEQVARERLGMRPPRASQVVVLQDDASIQHAPAPVAAPAPRASSTVLGALFEAGHGR